MTLVPALLSVRLVSAETIERTDLEAILAAHTGNASFSHALESTASGEELLRVLGRYIHFNGTFGGGVANLAGEIGVRQDLFRDPEEELAICADRSMDVASDIFAAAVDEFDDRATHYRDTHRSLAQATLKGTGRFFGHEAGALNEIITLNPPTLAAIMKARDGYGINQRVDDTKLFQAMGFHMGSEMLADEEFRILDGYLGNNQADLVAYLKKIHVTIDDVSHPAYYWIEIHTSVEADHFARAVRGANRALKTYAGADEPARVKKRILEGFANFAEVQCELMEGLPE